ncbi:hypothetical protein FB45DRAFT_944496 [Roridomyces roridus]|uniref:Uncharacterized protein n=1 Tax=Roridomyces roridus TaxID=1738132 RepID=A0AAD7B3Z8_9AGAR|nr:hypothetical protein FB45DRAFT_944496 [Roridomyces roridus]
MAKKLKLGFYDNIESDGTMPPKEEHLARLRECVNVTRIELVMSDDGGDSDSEDEEDTDEPRPSMASAWKNFLEVHLPAMGANYPSVTCLQFSSRFDTLVPLGTITHILACFPGLEVLKIQGNMILSDDGVRSSHVPPARLHTMQLHGAEGTWRFFFDWLAALPVLPPVKTLELSNLTEKDQTSLHAYTQRAGHRFESIPSYAWLTTTRR